MRARNRSIHPIGNACHAVGRELGTFFTRFGGFEIGSNHCHEPTQEYRRRTFRIMPPFKL